MTRETYCVAVFYPAVAAGLLWPYPAWHIVAAVAAAGFLICQALILHAAKGIPTWRTPDMPWMLIATGMFEGLGLLAVIALASGGQIEFSPPLALTGIALAIVNAVLWTRYRMAAASRGIGPLSREALARVTPVLHLVGHATPVVLFAVCLFSNDAQATILAGIGGAAAIAGGMLWKFFIVTRACHQQGFAMPLLPRRGSGKRAAPGRFGQSVLFESTAVYTEDLIRVD
jgi:phenylacetyl-CoA:acceptor oxidoreductase subunit 2